MTEVEQQRAEAESGRTPRVLAGMDRAQQWTQVADGPLAYPKIAATRGVSIVMDDGVVLKADIYRPAGADGRPVADPLPVLLGVTGYPKLALYAGGFAGRVVRRFRPVFDWIRDHQFGPRLTEIADLVRGWGGGGVDVTVLSHAMIRSGYVGVLVDARGTGGSSGRWEILGEREQRDGIEIGRWITAQPWCDGSIGAFGTSYGGVTALQAAGNRIPGLRAAFSVVPADDCRRDILKTGGMHAMFIPLWMLMVAVLRWVVMPSDIIGGLGKGWLAGRLREPLNSIPRYWFEGLRGHGDMVEDDARIDGTSAHVENIEVPTFLYGAWNDVFGSSAITAFQRLRLAGGRRQVIMNDGTHSNVGSRLGGPGAPPRLDVLQRAWFDKWLKGIDNGIDEFGPVTLEQQGGGWQTLETFPRQEATPRRLYLGSEPSGVAGHAAFDGTLGPVRPASRTEHALQQRLSQWRSGPAVRGTAGAMAVLGTTGMRDTRTFEGAALTFTTPEVTEPWLLTGPLSLHLVTKTASTEGIWVVTVNDVAPDGFSQTIAEGALLSSRRGIDEGRSRRTPAGDYLQPSHLTGKGQQLAVQPGVPTVLDIALSTLDAVIAPGHRLRVVISGANLVRYLPSIPQLRASRRGQSIVLDPEQPSYLVALVDGGNAPAEVA